MSDGREELRDENPRLTIPKLNMRPQVNHHGERRRVRKKKGGDE